MIRGLKYYLFLFSFSFFLSNFLQAGDLRQDCANLYQDLEIMQGRLGQLQIEMEEISRQNKYLAKQIVSQDKEQRALNTSIQQLNHKVNTMKNDWVYASGRQKDEIIAQVVKEVEKVARSAAVSNAPKKTEPKVTFSDDYPKEGIAYTVKPGDTLEGIAQKHNSRIKDIQNANRIANPARDLRANQTIFIPQRS